MKSEHKVSKDRIEKLINISFPFSGLPEEVQVMEMLDVIPKEIKTYMAEIDTMINRLHVEFLGNEWSVEHMDCEFETINTSLPNALADLIFWLHENKYLTF